MSRILGLSLLLFACFPALASAGTVAVGQVPLGTSGGSAPVVTFTAAAGERNQLVLSRELTGGTHPVLLHDGGATLLPGTGCAAIDERTVRCPQAQSIVIDAGDGDDAVTLPSEQLFFSVIAIGGEGNDTLTGLGALYGGPGNDVLTGSDSAACSNPKDAGCGETLVGGAGDDVLRGRGGGDVLIGDGVNTPAPGAGALRADSLGNDVIDGGAGVDTVSYQGHSRGVRVDISDSGPDGAAGERDRVTGVENIVGGDGDDVLLGDDGRNELTGGAGSDRMYGRGGNDRLTDIGPGADTLHGGSGNDKVYASGRRDRLYGESGNDVLSSDFDGGEILARTLSCGSGTDSIRGRPHGQLLSRCESVQLNPPYIGPVVSAKPSKRPRGRLRFRWSCMGPDILVGCEMAVTVRARSAATRRTVSIPIGLTKRSFRIPLRGSTRRANVLSVSIKGGLDYGAKGGVFKYTARWRVRL